MSPHLLKRMVDRDFTEVDLRVMMESASRLRENEESGRWVVEATHEMRPWEVIVEPDLIDKLLVVAAAYPLDLP